MTSGTAMLNHALKNDLGKIKLFSDKIKRFAVDCSQQELTEDIQVILNAQQHIYSLLNRIQEQIKERTLYLDMINLIEILERCLRTLGPFLTEIRVVRDYGSSALLLCDEDQIEEVFYNILSNALEAMSYRGKLTIRVLESKKNVVVEIKDTGVGISKENLPRIFDPFFTTKGDSSRNFGLGLSYCYNVIRMHRGSIEILSKENQGTTVFIKLPK
ncbi:ATP-binding protein [Effusibacillus consociatus]